MKFKPSETAAFLRQKAEALLNKKPSENNLQLSEAETLKLIHEYKVQQIELENQLDELKRAKESLSISENRYQSLFVKAGEGIFIMSLKGELLEVSESFAHMHGYTVDEMLNINIKDLDTPETSSMMPERMKQILENKQLTFEVKHYHKDGHIIQLEASVSLITINGISLIQSFHRDISERKKAEAKLKENEEFLKETQTIAMLGTYVMNIENGQWTSSEVMDQIFGIDADYIRSVEGWTALLAPEWQELMNAYFIEKVIGQQTDFDKEYKIIRQNDKVVRWVHGIGRLKFNAEHQPIMMLGTIQDITERKQMDEALRESEENYRFMFANNPQPMMIYDLETLVFLEVNDACCNLYGYSEKEFLSKTLKDIHSEDDISLLLKDIDFARSGENPGGEWRNVRKNGDIIFVEITSHTVNYKGQKARHILISNITSRKQTEENVSMLAHAIRSISECVSITDNSDKIIFVNEAFLKTYQYEENEILGKSIDMFRSPNNTPADVENILTATINGGWQGEILNCRKDGSEFPVFLSTSIIHNDKGEQIALIGVANDISSRKQSEAEIKLKNEELLKLNAEKDKYFSIIAHDLRSPFNSFLGLTQIMAEELEDLTMDEIQKFAVSMRNSATNLFRLLENLLEWSRIQQGLIPFRPNKVLLLPIMNESIEMVVEFAKNKNIDIVYEIPHQLEVFADTNILQTILRNLVLNAVKFTNKNGDILISAKATNENSCVISIRDNGIGMDQKRIDNLFRMDITTSRNGTEGETSTGLGLIICRDFIEKHGGKLWIESEVNQGSCFYFSLPIAAEPLEINPTENISQAENTDKKTELLNILIAEDDEVSEMLLSMMVKKFCNSVYKAKNGLLALETLQLHPEIDLILMDIQMPQMNGIEATQRIRQFNQKVIIIAQTAYNQSDEKEKALAAGCNDFICKPLNDEELKEKIFRQLKIKN